MTLLLFPVVRSQIFTDVPDGSDPVKCSTVSLPCGWNHLDPPKRQNYNPRTRRHITFPCCLFISRQNWCRQQDHVDRLLLIKASALLGKAVLRCRETRHFVSLHNPGLLRSFEMSRTDCRATQCHTPEERTPQAHCGSLKTCQLTHCTSAVIQKRQPTNCMGQTPSWKATSWTASQKLSQVYSPRKFVTMLIIIRHLSPSWATWNQSTLSSPVVWEYILVLFSLLRLGLPVVPFIQSSPPKHSMPNVPHAEYKSCGSPLCSSTTCAAIQCYLHQFSYIL